MLRWFPVVAVVAVGIVVSGVVFRSVAWRQEKIAYVEFERMARTDALVLRQNIERYTETLRSIGYLYATVDTVTRAEFRTFTQAALSQAPGIQALEWTPKVTADQREHYERAAQLDGFSGFSITERDSFGQIVPAGPRATYYPVYFVEPYAGNEAALGYAPILPTRDQAIIKARDTGMPAASHRIRLIQETDAQWGILLFAPVYAGNGTPTELSERRQRFRGVVQAVFRISDMLTPAVQQLKAGYDVNVLLRDESAVEESALLFATPGADADAVIYQESFPFADRIWSLQFAPSPSYFTPYRTMQPWLVLAIGLLATALLAGYLIFLRTQHATIERTVAERTAALSAAKHALEQEVEERHQTEVRLREAKQKAEEANYLKTTFLANMSHELRTPMVGVIGFASLIESEVEDEAIRGFADRILTSSHRLLNTLDDLLILAQLESRKLIVDLETMNLAVATAETVKLLEPLAQQKGLWLKVILRHDPVFAELDPKLLDQIINNLVGNALKFTETGGVTVIVDQRRLNSGDRAVLRVIDTGIGISPNFMSRLFDEFRQESSGYARKYEGVGLGLAITQRVTTLMRGTITVESEQGAGSVFTVAFPLVEAPDLESAPRLVPTSERPSTSLGARTTVLLVEDDPVGKQLAEELLGPHCDLETAMTGDEALERIAMRQYDIVLMDINLGQGMDGVETMRRIRETPAYEKTSIIAFTAYAREEDRKNLLDVGFSDYLSKPYSNEQLFHILETHID